MSIEEIIKGAVKEAIKEHVAPSRLFKKEELLDYLQCSSSTFNRMIRANQIKSYDIIPDSAKSRRYSIHDIIEKIEVID